MNGATPWLGDRGARERRRRPRGRRRAATGRSRSIRTWTRSTDVRRAASCRPITTTIATTTGAVHSVAGPGTVEARRGSRRSRRRLCERNRIQPKHDQVERDEPAQPAGRSQAAAQRVLDDQADAVERAPQHERPRRAVPEAAEHHRDHQVAVGRTGGRRGCRRAGCRGSRAGSATASCASAARSRGSRSRGTGCGSSAGRRSPAAARGRSPCRCSPRSRSRSAPCRRRRRAATSGAA